jgi:hypothetical protein
MTDRELLIWIHQRLVKVHGESPLVDYMHRLRDVIHGMPKDRDSAGRVVTMHSHDVLKEIELSDPPQVPPADVRASSPTSGGGFVERELAVARRLAACRGDDARLDEADTELADLRQACKEGWRYAAELDEQRKHLQAELDRMKRYAAVAMNVRVSTHDEMQDGGRWLARWEVVANFSTPDAAFALADTLRRPTFDAA